MTKLKVDPITAEELADFVKQEPDFAFELRVLEELRRLGFDCSHSGTYRDPVSDKVRQYDIRAVKKCGRKELSLSVECKNYRPNCPLLVSTTPRTAAEAFHDLVVSRPNGSHQPLTVDSETRRSTYKMDEPVGKKTNQVRRDSSGKLVGDDAATFAKLNQAVNSCRDLIAQPLPNYFRRAIVPVLVVPEDVLWRADYTTTGAINAPPQKVKHATLFLNQAWETNPPIGHSLEYRLSHLEFATIDALREIIENHFGSTGFFPND